MADKEEAKQEAPQEEAEEKVFEPAARNMYGFIREAWKNPDANEEMHQIMWERLIQWRQEPSFVRVEKPTRLYRARGFGYKAKRGFVVVGARVRRKKLHTSATPY